MIEVLSKSTRKRDETIKLALYDAMGVREYWIADPDARTIQVYRSRNGRLALAGELSMEDRLETPLLPGLSISLQQIFE